LQSHQNVNNSNEQAAACQTSQFILQADFINIGLKMFIFMKCPGLEKLVVKKQCQVVTDVLLPIIL
jgi:hypothetical protein